MNQPATGRMRPPMGRRISAAMSSAPDFTFETPNRWRVSSAAPVWKVEKGTRTDLLFTSQKRISASSRELAQAGTTRGTYGIDGTGWDAWHLGNLWGNRIRGERLKIAGRPFEVPVEGFLEAERFQVIGLLDLH